MLGNHDAAVDVHTLLDTVSTHVFDLFLTTHATYNYLCILYQVSIKAYLFVLRLSHSRCGRIRWAFGIYIWSSQSMPV